MKAPKFKSNAKAQDPACWLWLGSIYSKENPLYVHIKSFYTDVFDSVSNSVKVCMFFSEYLNYTCLEN